MPVQINEVIVKAVVDPCPPSTGNTQSGCPPAGNGTVNADVTENILLILKENKER